MFDNMVTRIFNMANLLIMVFLLVILIILVVLALLFLEYREERNNSKEQVAKSTEIRKSDIATSRVQEDLECDELTGVANRSAFNRLMQQDLDGYRFSVIYGDINGLRDYNSRNGYKEGDRQVKMVYELLAASAPEAAQLFRINGAEFLLLIPDVDEKEGEKNERLIREQIIKSEEIELDVALGVAYSDDMETELRRLVMKAENRMMKDKVLCSSSSKSSQLNLLLYLIEEKFQETEQHARRVQDYAMKIYRKLDMPDDEEKNIYLLSVLHDIGKICIPDSILKKPDKLDLHEWDEMKQHCVKGARILRALPELEGISYEVLCHHENWNGSGYPMGLRGEEIPMLARIVRIVDSYDAMTEERVYSRPLTHSEAISELCQGAEIQYDPCILDVFLEVLEEEKEAVA